MIDRQNKGYCLQLNKDGAVYYVDIDITVQEWKKMLLDSEVFNDDSKQMVLQWYFQEDHQATFKTIMKLYHLEQKGTIYNGIVVGLAKRILRYLKHRFYVRSYDGGQL